MAKGENILLARIGAAHGVRGEVRVKAFTADPLSLAEYSPLAAGDGQEFHVERLRPAKEVVMAKFRGIDSRDAAEALNGTDLFVSRDRLPATDTDDEFYQADLIGLEAFSEAGVLLGAVIAVQNFGAGDLLEIAPRRGPSLLVPFTRQAVPSIDIGAGRLVAVPPSDAEDDEVHPTAEQQEQEA